VSSPRNSRLGETYRRVGVSAFAKHHQLSRDLLIIIAVSKSSLTSPDADTLIRRPADTLPQPAAHFDRLSGGCQISLAVFQGASEAPLSEHTYGAL
jgi:hypothetical protein